jgi:hypothetical protein
MRARRPRCGNGVRLANRPVVTQGRNVKRAPAALAVLITALLLGVAPAPALAGTIVWGVNDDAGKFEDGDGPFFGTLTSIGFRQNVMTVRWDETAPTEIPDRDFLERAIARAGEAGVDVELDVYPLHSRALGSDPRAPGRFAAWVGLLAESFPEVKQFVVMNECNQPLFVRPQFRGSRRTSPNISAAVCGRALALSYDALNAVNPAIFVWGIGLSPRGNDRPDARSNVSTSPIQFLRHLGAWYRKSGRTTPLMDGLDVHPYPIPQSLPFDRGYAAPNNYSVANLPRVYQAFYDAFRGTAQPTIGPGGLKVQINEIGVQTSSVGRGGYFGLEPPGLGVAGATATEAYQAAWYGKLVRRAGCDPNVASVNLFHLIDEADLAVWQSGLFYRGYVPKVSAAVVKAALEGSAGACLGTLRRWRPAGVVSHPARAARLRSTQVKRR